MSAKIDKFCNTLRDRLNTVDGRLTSIKENVQALPKQADKAVRDKLDQAQRKLRSQKDRIDQTRTNQKAHIQQKVAETKEAVNEWKAKRDTRKLTARADRAEAYAADAIEFAAFAMD